MYFYMYKWEKRIHGQYHFFMSVIISRFIFFFLIHAFTCILSICIPHVAISKTKENCMSIFLMNGNIMFGNDKQDN